MLHVELGDVVPADGVLVSGHSIRCDESSVTGESDQKNIRTLSNTYDRK
jgi:Ca2+-transporting ATPase